jgi:hypothetical protein
LGLPSFLYCRIVITVSPTPMASLAARVASEGAVLGLGGLLGCRGLASDPRPHPFLRAQAGHPVDHECLPHLT